MSFGIDVEQGSGPEIQYQTPSANYNASSVILPCPPADQSVALHRIHDNVSMLSDCASGDQMSFTNVGMYCHMIALLSSWYVIKRKGESPKIYCIFVAGPSLGQWCNEQQVDSQYASSFSPSSQADLQSLLMQNGFSIDQFLEGMTNDVFSQLCAPGVNDLQADVCCGMAKPPCRRWVKLAVLAKWLAMLRVSKSKVLA